MTTVIEMGGKKYGVYHVEDTQHVSPIMLREAPKWITYDTESTGLHIKKDIPFLGAVCWSNSNEQEVLDGTVCVFPTTKENLKHLKVWATLTDRVYAHNTTFDMHMTANIMGDDFPTRITNWGDTMGLCRLSFEAVSTRDGGDSLALKAVSKKYIDPNADVYEKQVKAWLKIKKAENNKLLTAMLKGVNCTKRDFEQMLKGAMEWNSDAFRVYRQWLEAYPDPTYQDVPLEIMIPYAATDVILTDILVGKALPIVEYRQQQKIMEMEFRLLRTVYKMERVGIETDREYLMEANAAMETYIEDLKIRMAQIAGRDFTVGQHAVIKEIYTEKLGTVPASTDKQFLKKQAREGDKLAAIISTLRRLEKWKETYIERILEVSSYDGRFYTTLGQFNPVSGRFSGDAQQFPKDVILTEEGERLKTKKLHIPDEHVVFVPRRAFCLPNGYYLDYSQVELRVQGHYTLYFGGDINLCRAYMPFRCTHYQTGETYKYDTFVDRWRWNELKPGAPADLHWEDQLKQGWSVWEMTEQVPESEEYVTTGKPWIPTDVHSATSLKALRIMGHDPDSMTKDELKHWRDIGKRFNFMRKMLAHVKPFELLETLTA